MNMITIKTADLSGPALDWAVAKVEALEIASIKFSRSIWVRGLVPSGIKPDTTLWEPSTNWSQGGPLIEKYDPEERRWPERDRSAEVWISLRGGDAKLGRGVGPTRLIAACRAIVAAKLGDEVQVPVELAGGAV